MWTILILGLLVLGSGYYFFSFPRKKVHGNFRLGTAELQVEIADSFAKQYQGLSDRDSLCDNCGMLFVYNSPRIQNFVMRRMRFPLDFVFIREGEIVEVVENVPPPKSGETPIYITSSVTADGVLEVNAGFMKKNHLKLADRAILGPTSQPDQ